MAELTPAQVAALIGFLDTFGASRDALHDWVTCPVDGGPNSDGYVLFPDKNGVEKSIISPAKLASLVPSGQPTEQEYRLFANSAVLRAGDFDAGHSRVAMNVNDVWAYCIKADQSPAGTAGIRATIKANSIDMLTTPITIAPGQFVSLTAAVQPVIANAFVAKGARLTGSILTPGVQACGLVFILAGHRA